MFFLYNLLVAFAGFALKIVALFSPKMKLFVDGRRNVFGEISAKIKPSDQTIWFHAASLGEYEQGLPVIEKIKESFPNHKIVLTFFSEKNSLKQQSKMCDDVLQKVFLHVI